MIEPRVVLTITTTSADGAGHVLTLDTPRASWTLDELHELARTAGEAVGMLGDHTLAVRVAVSFGLDRA